MEPINLHKIFCHLVDDPQFLSSVIETESLKHGKKKNKKKSFDLMDQLVVDYSSLSPYDIQNYDKLPMFVRSFLLPKYSRFGIKNVMDKNLSTINISFLHSLNILLRPDIYNLNIEDHLKNFSLLETFVIHKIQRNYQIDKTKNTKKVQNINRELIKNLMDGKISHPLIQYIVNIFEINLLVFDFVKNEVILYWCNGFKYPYINLFKQIVCMAYIHGNYEPIMPHNDSTSTEDMQKIYCNILMDDCVKYYPNATLNITSIIYMHSWNIPVKSYCKIISRHYKLPKTTIKDSLNALKKLEEYQSK